MPRSTEKAFSLIEAVVAIAIMAILAGAAVPLVIKAVNQQREQKTRENMKMAFEAMFGARDKRVANMRADFGYEPGVTTTDLSWMTTAGGIQAYAPDLANGGLPWGWNGPYWVGTIQPLAGTFGNPVDGWGYPFRLNCTPGPNPTWQLQSGGPNGVLGGAVPDDIYYPPNPVNYLSTLIVNVQRTSTTAVTALAVNVSVTDRLNGLPHAVTDSLNTSFPYSMAPKEMKGWTYSLRPGVTRVVVNGANNQLVDLKPGELQTITFLFD